MSFNIQNLDDRRFEDLVAEATQRLQQHLPELTHIPPGDPAHAFIDLFAWLTETILYRANLIPERQRRAFLNLLDIPIRPATPATSLVCIDAGPRSIKLPSLVSDSTGLKAGEISFSTVGEVQPTPLQMHIMIKQAMDQTRLDEAGINLNQIREQYKSSPNIIPFKATPLFPGSDTLSLAESIDHCYYLAFTVPQVMVKKKAELIQSLRGIQLNIAITPANELDADVLQEVDIKRQLKWELIYQNEDDQFYFYPLLIKNDSSNGGKQLGVVRLALPDNTQLFDSIKTSNPLMTGYDQSPPALPESIAPERTAFWIRLKSDEDPDLELGYLGVNGVKVIAQGVIKDKMIGRANGHPNQIHQLQNQHINPESLELQVEDGQYWQTWQAVKHFQSSSAYDTVYQLDESTGTIRFGNGINGKRPPEKARIRTAYYRHGGGSAGNLPADSIKEITESGHRTVLRHEWPSSGGIDSELVTDAENRIGDFLNHRNRAVTANDFIQLALENPVNPVARAKIISGFIPGNSITAIRRKIPGAVSIFILPPGDLSNRRIPRASKGLLKDVYSYLQSRCLLGTELYVLSPEYKPMALSIHVSVSEPDLEGNNESNEQSILREVEESVYRYLWPLSPGGSDSKGWQYGRSISSAELIIPIAKVAGVIAIKDITLYKNINHHWQVVPDNHSITLEDYQLPECLGISVKNAADGISPSLPDGLTSSPSQNNEAVAAPIMPESC
ncbi:MAG: putative baseplate assembly protein [Gammaproteobacteria bacterium]|nr:putative baseplate assembly protein [Gammaproteobacteria bacterium]